MTIKDVPYWRVTELAFRLNALLDCGARVPLQDVAREVEAGSLFIWLRSTYPETFHPTSPGGEDERCLSELFGNLWNAVDARRKFGVSEDGLCLILAYCIEAIQEVMST